MSSAAEQQRDVVVEEAGRVFGALGLMAINVIAIAMGSSECSISLVVEAKDAEQTVRCLHTLI